jgi:hypothetical protein
VVLHSSGTFVSGKMMISQENREEFWGHQMDLSQAAPLVKTSRKNPILIPVETGIKPIHSKRLKGRVRCCTRFYLSFRCMLIWRNTVSSFHFRTILISWLTKGWYRE